MDPNEVLREIRKNATRLLSEALTDDQLCNVALDLADDVEALDSWLSRGGFLPTAWTEVRG